MNYIKLVLLLSIFGLSRVSCNAEKNERYSYMSVPQLDRGTLSLVTVPLYQETGDIWIRDVPAKLFGPARDGILRAMCSPVYAASSEIEERQRDINLISICKIRISLKSAGKEDEYLLVIDLSGAEEPTGSRFGLASVVQAALTCIRMQFPPFQLGKVNVKVVDGPKGTKWDQFEGPLWPH